LTAAFARTQRLSANDAGLRAKRHRGVIATHLNESDATLMVAALAAAGIGATIVDDALLDLPTVFSTARIATEPDHLVWHDALGRPARRPWSQVRAVAVGRLRGIEWIVQDVSAANRVKRHHARTARRDDPVYDQERVSHDTERVVLELGLEEPRLRLRLFADSLVPAATGAPWSNRQRAFTSLVADIAAHATHAAHGSGVALAAAGQTPDALYRISRDLEQELAWLWWRAPQATTP